MANMRRIKQISRTNERLSRGTENCLHKVSARQQERETKQSRSVVFCVCRISVCDGSFMHAHVLGRKRRKKTQNANTHTCIFEMVRTMHTLISLNLCVHTYTQIMIISIRSDALAPRPFSLLFLSAFMCVYIRASTW